LTLSAFEELYNIEIKEHDSDGFGQTYLWNIGELRDRKENKA